jgi:hypothetical protein
MLSYFYFQNNFLFGGAGFGGRVRLSPLGRSVNNWPTIPTADERLVWSILVNENWQRKPKYSEQTCSSATLSTINPTWLDLSLNPVRRGLSFVLFGKYCMVLLHVHPLLGNVLVNKFSRIQILGKQSVARLPNNRWSCIFCVVRAEQL